MSESDRIRLMHMRDAAKDALAFVADRCREDLDTDKQLLYATVKALEIIGEAAVKLSPDTRGQMPDLPWAKIIGMRNRLIHAYADLVHDVIWNTVVEAIPTLLTVLNSTLAESDQGAP